jgi:ketosteroid isomerase-like protein
MSQENVNRFLKATELFNRLGATAADSLNPEDINGFLGFMHPEIHFEPQQALIQGSYEGPAGVLAWLADLAEHYAGGRMECEDVRDLGETVLALGTLRVTGRGSGIEIEVPLAVVAGFREGLIAQLRDYGDNQQALEAVGLSE